MESLWKEASALRRVRLAFIFQRNTSFKNNYRDYKKYWRNRRSTQHSCWFVPIKSKIYSWLIIIVCLVYQAITVYTVIGVFSKDFVISSMKITLGVLSVIWAFILILVAIPNVINHYHSFQSPVPVRIIFFFFHFVV